MRWLAGCAAAVLLLSPGAAQETPATRPAVEPAVTLHPTSAMVRIGGVDGAIPPPATSYALEMARNEREGFQFAVLPVRLYEGPVRPKVRAQSPAAPGFTVYQVLAVNHVAPPTGGQFVVPPRRLGWTPDVLMPVAGRPTRATATRPAEGEAPLTYYVEFRTGTDTQPGMYRYEVAIEPDEGREPAERGRAPTLTVELRVRDVAVPTPLPFRTSTTWSWSLPDYFGRPLTREEKQAYWDFCLDHRLSPCEFFSKTPEPGPADLAAMKDKGLNVAQVFFVGGQKPRLLSDEAKARFGPQLRQWREHLRAADMLDVAYVLLADEPVAEAVEICRANAEWIREQLPEAKIWVATKPDEAWADFADMFDPCMAWSTEFYRPHSHTDEALRWWRHRRPYPDGEYWWFHSVEPYAPYTNVRLDNLPIEGRVAGWQSALYGVDGYEYVWITAWKDNQDTRDMSWPQRAATWKTGMSGAGTLCYPDERMRPMPSLRLVNLRDGLEDWALIEMAAPSRCADARQPLVSSVARNLAEWTSDPVVVLAARAKVLDALERGTPAATTGSPPATMRSSH